MRGQFGVIGPYTRDVLDTNWAMAAQTPGSANIATPPGEDEWININNLLPVAAALRGLNLWSLDQQPTRFDGQDWWYRLRFDAPQAHTAGQYVLGLDGLATVASVWLNGSEILRSDNMFVAHECDISTLIQPEGNTLLMRFSSLDTLLAIRRKRPRWRAPMMEHQQLRWFRTTLLGRTPGWSPPAAVVGPWKDVWIERRQSFELTGLRLDTKVQGTSGVLLCSFDVQSLDASDLESAEIRLNGQGHAFTQILSRGVRCFQGELHIPDVALWWPHTHGEPHLYSISLAVRAKGAKADMAFDLGRVGFRTICVNSAGGDFSLSVNGVPVFCRGACWSPLDPVTLRASVPDYKVAIQQVQTAGMNMLRVAGTMVYEDDAFFDACDEFGILVWQDFMFANMDYPSDDPNFMLSVALEVKQQLHRIRARACLAVLCGNSEVSQQAAMWGAPREQWRSAFFETELAQWCAAAAPAIPYWPSSAFGGAFPHQGDVGTTSYYGVGAYLRGLEDARTSNLRFATECLAFANIPADSNLKRMPGGLATRVHHPGWKARSPRDLGAGWDFDDVRDHYMRALFDVDPVKLRYSDHERYLVLGRMATGEVMAAAFAQWRKPGSQCRGAMVLFMRDLWAGAGWGVVDDAGIPKACYHYLKRSLQPTTVLLTDEGCNGLFVHVLNESAHEKELELELKAWVGGSAVVANARKLLKLRPHSAHSFSCAELFDHFMDLNYAYRFGPLPCDVVVATLRQMDGSQLAQTFYFPAGLGNRQDADLGLSAEVIRHDHLTINLTVRTQRFAQGVHFDVPGYVADAEYFHLAPDSEVCVTLRSLEERAFGGVVRAVNSRAELRLDVSP